MAAARAVLGEICTPEETSRVIERNSRFATDCQAALAARGMPAHVAQCGATGCVTWSRSRIRNYRDYLAADFDIAFAQWIWGVNRGVLYRLVWTSSGCCRSPTPSGIWPLRWRSSPAFLTP
jgi:glutamate-1-semialdehyde 2,1-aminomutase